MEKKKFEGWKIMAIIVLVYSLAIITTGSMIFIRMLWTKAALDSSIFMKVIYYTIDCICAGLSASTILMHIYIIHEILK